MSWGTELWVSVGAGGAGLREPHRGNNGPCPGPVRGAGSAPCGTSAQLSPGVPPAPESFMCSLCREIPAEVQEFDLILLKELNLNKKISIAHKKSGGGWGAEGGS